MSLHKTVHGAYVKALGGRTHRFKISDAGPDHMHDDLPLEGWNFSAYNGRVLWAHDQSIPAIARSAQPWVTGDGVYADAEFPPPGVYPFADQIEALVAAGHLGDASVGFKPDPATAVRNKHGGFTYPRKHLLEWSIVNTPANPRARLVEPSARGADLVTITKWLGEATRPTPLLVRKGETVFTGPTVPVASGTAPGESRLSTWTAMIDSARVSPRLRDTDLPPGVTKVDVTRRIQQGIRDQMALIRKHAMYDAINQAQEEAQRLRKSY